ncbi:MAG: TlpA disulfide reductase family protein [Gemmatimonadaceae bacterium]
MRRFAAARAGALRWIAITAVATLGTSVACDPAGTRGPRGAVTVGQPAPAYAATRLDGAPIALADLRGQVVLLNIWATWCKPCREEIPALEALHQAYAARGLVVAGVSIDAHGDTANIAGFARDLGATYPLWLDANDRVSTTFLAIGVPSTFLIDRGGVLRWKHLGAVKADDAALLAALDSAIAEPGPDAAGSEAVVDRR